MSIVRVGDIDIDNRKPFVLIAGPCVMESFQHTIDMAVAINKIATSHDIPFVFKASFDKANRTRGDSPRGVDMENGLYTLQHIQATLGIPVTTDVHLPDQVSTVAEVVDLIQIPAFLCRQTDMIEAASRTGKPTNVKKGQFLAPDDVRHIKRKFTDLTAAGGFMVTERGTTFGHHDLVVDYRGVYTMVRDGTPVIFDASHSCQTPGIGGNRNFTPPLAAAAAGVGVAGIFLEVHDRPEEALSDARTQWPLELLSPLLSRLKNIDEASKADW